MIDKPIAPPPPLNEAQNVGEQDLNVTPEQFDDTDLTQSTDDEEMMSSLDIAVAKPIDETEDYRSKCFTRFFVV
jgi:hypothetical protein